MHPVFLLAIYCAVVAVASLVGGWVPLVMRLTHRRMQIAISFVSGVMLGIGLLHLLPHSYESLGAIDPTVTWVLAGFLFMFFLERFFAFHHHDAPDEGSVLDGGTASRESSVHTHVHAVGEPPRHGHAHGTTSGSVFPWGGAAIGLTLHGLVDGVAIAAAIKAESATDPTAWAGLGAGLAIALHKPFDSLTIGTLMAASGRSARSRHVLNALYALVTPLGAVLFYALGSGPLEQGLGQALGFAAGAFICIATSDLLPELQFHRHDRAVLSAALLAGIALAWSTVFLEGEGHGHSHAPASAPSGAHDHDHE
jgi:zinc and cadmium transporter